LAGRRGVRFGIGDPAASAADAAIALALPPSTDVGVAGVAAFIASLGILAFTVTVFRQQVLLNEANMKRAGR
jgi:hypothetical protein